MKAQLPDDIFALYAHYDLDGENYRVFPKAAPQKLESASTASDPLTPKITELKLADEAALLQDRSHPDTPTRTVVTAKLETPEFGEEFRSNPTRPEFAARAHTWAALHNLRRYVTTPTALDHTRVSKVLAASSFSIHGVAGGVGATTIAAVLARLLARSGRRVGIFDEQEFSTLPVFFGGNRIGRDQRRLAGLYSLFQPEIRILSHDVFEPAPLPVSTGTFIERNSTQLADHYDHLIFDQSGRTTDGSGAAVPVYVAIPDVSSVLGTKKLRQYFGTQHTNTRVMCVLNRFDFATPLHREVLAWFQENFPEVITVNNSPLVPEALAEGMTVVDWAPSSEVANDLVNLYNAIGRLLARNGLTSPNTMNPADFGPERLPLCC